VSLTISPDDFDGVILDMDGVLTDTVCLHAQAWRLLLDQALAGRGPRPGEDHQPFSDEDYRQHMDGRPRYDAVGSFLASRGVTLPWGEPADLESAETVCGLGNRKDAYFSQLVHHRGVRVFAGTVVFVRACRLAGLRTAIVSASRNCAAALAAGGVESLFDVRMDGVIADALGLPGRPDPAIYLQAARLLSVRPERALVVLDVEAGRAPGRGGGFGLVLGVDRSGLAGEVRSCGADRIVTDLSEVSVVCSVDLDKARPSLTGYVFGGATTSGANGESRSAHLSS
jgi:alpha,alpha-trehalase